MRPPRLASLLLLTFALPALAGDAPGTRKVSRREEQRLLDEAVKRTNAACGAAMRMRIDWSTWAAQDPGERRPHEGCSAFLKVVEHICETSEGQGYMRRMLKTVRCEYQETGMVLGLGSREDDWVFFYSTAWERGPEYARKLENWMLKLAP
ncbi:hypothetical protein [Cystobacter ferrugineus]|uniref:Uncharacterized protein n=1 Tax=Cystobacter ferrugineus TaxID=83449 RepID=A0A1L9BA15_9BACT|nr:hypothetical protein [Cystobacter ferrugineus]OJH39120.1 hypothetical protein BON30_16365 [Cystobacter ferrugineus]